MCTDEFPEEVLIGFCGPASSLCNPFIKKEVAQKMEAYENQV